MSNKKLIYDEVLFQIPDPKLKSKRKCRKCDIILNNTRYYTCEKCTPVLEESDWDNELVYHEVV